MNNPTTTTAPLLIAMMLAASAYAQQDRFAQIGGREYRLNTDALVEPGPPTLHDKRLPQGTLPPSATPFGKQADTPEALQEELASIRRRHQPFLRNLSPLTDGNRQRIEIPSMDWRVETTEDRSDFPATLQGEGAWKEVRIPHYGPPLGHAVTYYTRSIELDEAMLSKGSLFACFKGVDYKAEVYFNGALVGTHEGFFAPFECDISRHARKGTNRLLVKVVNEPTTTGSTDGMGNHVVGDKIYAAGGPGYDDPVEGWHICPPAMGIYQDCYIEARPSVFINDIFVRPLPEKDSAEVWMEVYNAAKDPRHISLSLSVLGRNFPDTVFLGKRHIPSTTIVPGIGDMVKPTDWKEKSLPMEYGPNYMRIPVDMRGFRWWEPDNPWLYNLHATLRDEQGRDIDRQATHFGMRSFRMDTVSVPKGRMYLNGRMIRLRGANSMGFEQNDVMRKDFRQLTDDILLAKLCNMNYIRFTQRPVQQEVYDYCDMLGMLNQTDLPFFGAIRISRFREAVKQAEEMERLVRNHPSTIMVTYINERFPNAEGSPQRSYGTAGEVHAVFSALDRAVLLSNPDRVIKAGDGDYDPPSPGLPDNHCYNTWYNGHALDLGKFHKGYWQPIKPGWLYGCGEFGAEGLDPLNTMQKYYPAAWLPKDTAEDRAWNPSRISKAQTNTMHHMWYPTQKGVSDWIEASQGFQAWAMKLVMEAFRRDSRNVSSAIHLFIDAWPAGWMKAIMDVDRQPKKAFFAYRNALEPLMVSLRTDRLALYAGEEASVELWVCNDRNDAPKGAWLGYEVVVDGRAILRQRTDADIPLNAAAFQGHLRFTVPDMRRRTAAVVRAGLFDASGNCLHVNTQELDLHPAFSPTGPAVHAFGVEGSKAARLAKESGAPAATDPGKAGWLVIDDIGHYERNKAMIDGFVARGGTALFTELPAGDYSIGGTRVEIKKTVMGEYFFANPGERLLKSGMRDRDLFMWYDPAAGYIQPLLRNVFRAQGWEPLVTTGLCNFAGEDPSGYLAAAQRRHGKGRYILSEVTLAGRMRDNPSAYDLLRSLLDGNKK